MAYACFQTFLRRLENAGELRRIGEIVSPRLEITEVADRVMKRAAGGPALLFERPGDFRTPVAINVFGSRRRMSWALGVEDYEEVAEEIAALLKPDPPASLGDKLRFLGPLRRLAASPPKRVASGICREVVMEGDEADLTSLPILHCWPDDGGAFITLPMVFTYDPTTGKRNVGMYRIQVFDRRTAGMHWQIHKVGAEHHRKSEEAGRAIEAAVVLGGDPVYTFCAAAPLPPSIDEMLFAGFLRRKAVPMAHCATVDVDVPADAEIVIEGRINPDERRPEGPFGDHTGFYTPVEPYPVLHVTAITTRREPVYPATIVGRPPMEDAWIGKAVERIFLPMVRLMIPELVDMNLPVEACFHNIALVSIRKRYPGHAFKVMNAIWGLGQLMFTKMIFVFDADVNVQDVAECVWRMGNNLDPERDMLVTRGPVDVLDHAARETGFGSKVGFDCTRKLPEEGHRRPWPEPVAMSDDVRARVDALWPRLGL
jgi:4-hydroxy-3-polyprenylbenzoate decarboxylase